MRRQILAALLAPLFVISPPAWAGNAWQQIDTNPGAYWVATSGGRQLEIRCNGAGGLMLLLLGGAQPLPAEVETEGDIVVGVTLWPTGYTDATSLYWLGPFDNAVGGDFPSSGAFLDGFARADRLTITGPSGTPMFDTVMTGADWVRFGFGEVCGL